MSPREIQARLRAGRTVEQVAAEADVDEEWVARFSPPIEAEQRQVVARAKSIALATARRGESAQPLGVSVRWNLVDKGLRMTEGEFDQCWSAAHMRDQEWQVVFRFTSRQRSQVAEWELDLRDGTLSPRNRLATELGFVEAGRRRRPAEPLPPPPQAESKKRSATTAMVALPAAPAKKAAKRSVGKSAAKKSAKRPAAKKSAGRRSAAKKAAPRRAVAKKSAPKRAATKAAPSRTAKRAKSTRAAKATRSLRPAKRAKTTKAPAGASRKATRQPARPAAKKATKKKAAPPARRSAPVVSAVAATPARATVTRPPVDELAQRRLELVGVRSAPLNPRPVRRPPPVEVRPSERQPRRPAPVPAAAAPVEAPVPAPSRDDTARAERAAQRAARRSLAERRAAAGAPAAGPARARSQPASSAEPGVVPGLDVVPVPAGNTGDRVVTIRADRAAPPRSRGESDEGVTVANRAPLRPISPAARPNRRRFGRNR